MKASNDQVLLARQAIYRADNNIYGFELLFRNQHFQTALDVGEEIATNQVLVDYWTSFSNETINRDTPVFINVSENFLLSDYFLPINNLYVVIELLERITVTEAIIDSIKKWKSKGFKFALDDYDFSEQWLPILPLIDYIKVDVLEHDWDTIKAQKSQLAEYNFTWLAEKIETKDMFDRCKSLGFTLYQGHYLARPKKILGSVIRPSLSILTEIIQKASQADSSIIELTDLVTRDPKLSVQLLKLINSSLFTLPREIHDLKEAITFLGIDTLKKWAMMIAFVSDSSAPVEACRIVLTRAKACALVVLETEKSIKEDEAFLAGLLSGVDLLLELEPTFFISQMKLSQDIQLAVLKEKGALGQIIQYIKKLEFYVSLEPENIHTIDTTIIQQFSIAQDWADDVIAMLG